MERWLRLIALSIPAPFRPAAVIIVDMIIRVWKWSFELGRRGRDGWRQFLGPAGWLFRGLRELGYQVHGTLKWLILSRIPSVARWARDQAIRWATQAIRATRTVLQLSIAGLRRQALLLIAGVAKSVFTLRTWTSGQLRNLAVRVTRLNQRVFGVFGTPARLAAWLVAAMWMALWRFAWNNLDRYADAIWRRRRSILLRSVAEAERILGRLL